MALIVPNATSVGDKFQALDQAEPDSLDFEILGSPNGVWSGGEVTVNLGSQATSVNVSSGAVLVGGTRYDFAGTTLSLGVGPSDNQFAVVAVRVTDGSAELIFRTGAASPDNPRFPDTRNTASTFNAAQHLDLDTDVVLAAVYRSGVSNITASRIVDKRKFIQSAIFGQVTGAPTGGNIGEITFNPAPSGGVGSGVYVKKNDGTWLELAANVGAHLPVGAEFSWPGDGPVPEGCVESNGQLLLIAQYPALFSRYGTKYGGNGTTTFGVPNRNGRYLRGTIASGGVAANGSTTGADSFALTTAQLPAHSHPMAHVHNLGGHTHNTNLAAFSVTSGNANAVSHTHPPASGTNFLLRLDSLSDNRRNGWVWFSNNSGDGVPGIGIETVVSGITLRTMAVNWVSTATGNGGAQHQHTVSYNPPSTASGGPSPNSTGQSSTSSTSNTGSGSAISRLPASAHTRWVIRASLGPDPSFTGGSPANATALEETIIVELFGKGEAVAAEDALAQFRMPWPATVTGIRASVATASDSGGIQVSVDTEEVENVCYVTIDEGDLTSTSSEDSDVVAANFPFDVADDSLVTFDLTNAGTNAEGSLTVTLYVRRAS